MAMTDEGLDAHIHESSESCCGECGNRGACSRFALGSVEEGGLAGEGLFERLKHEIEADDGFRTAS